MKSSKWTALCIAVVVAGSLAVVGCKDESGPTESTSAVIAAGPGGVINSLCPIMTGRKVDPANGLVRTHKDKKVGFCCGECPAKWDKLTDAEKDASVAKIDPAK